MTIKAKKQPAKIVQRKTPPKATPKAPAQQPLQMNQPLRPETVLQLQRTHGNKYVQRVLSTQRPTIQRGWLGDMWDTVTDTVDTVWDAAMDLFDQPVIDEEYIITDKLAYLRSEPPALDPTGELIPKGQHVTVKDMHKKGNKMYVQVSHSSSEEGVAQLGWTLFSNMSSPFKAKKKEEEASKGTTPSTIDVDDIKLPETEQASDVPRREFATGLAELSDEEKEALKLAGKDDIVNKIDEAKRVLVKLKADLKAIKKDKSKSKSERRTEQKAKKKEISEQNNVIADLYKGVTKDIRAKIDIAVELKRAGLTPEAWFSKLYPSAKFLGVTIRGNQKVYQKQGWGGVHAELYERLKVAEQLLMDETGLTADELGKEMGIKRIGGLRHPKPATGSGTGVGLHSYGLAIDISSTKAPNPYLGKHKTNDSAPVVKRATQLINGGAFDIRSKAPAGEGKKRADKRLDQASKMFDLLSSASNAMKVYFQFRETEQVTLPDGQLLELDTLASAYSLATGEELLSVAEWQEQMKADYDMLHSKKTDFGEKMDPAKGFIGLDKRMVMAMVKAGLSWGGLLEQAKDIMHFDYRDGTIKRRPVAQLN